MSTPVWGQPVALALSDLDLLILAEVDCPEPVTAAVLASLLDVFEPEITYRCARLVDAGMLAYDGICYTGVPS